MRLGMLRVCFFAFCGCFLVFLVFIKSPVWRAVSLAQLVKALQFPIAPVLTVHGPCEHGIEFQKRPSVLILNAIFYHAKDTIHQGLAHLEHHGPLQPPGPAGLPQISAHCCRVVKFLHAAVGAKGPRGEEPGAVRYRANIEQCKLPGAVSDAGLHIVPQAVHTAEMLVPALLLVGLNQ